MNKQVKSYLLSIWDTLEMKVERVIGGHLDIGPVTFFGLNAMHCAVKIKTKRYGYITIAPPLYWSRTWYSPSIHVSPNATPWAATFMLGSFSSPDPPAVEKVAACWRRHFLGHNYDLDKHDPAKLRNDIYGLYVKHRESQ